METEQQQIVDVALKTFNDTIQEESDNPIPMGVIVSLTKVITVSSAKTMYHLKKDLEAAIDAIQSENDLIGAKSTCDLFMLYVTRTWLDLQEFTLLKKKLLKRGEQFRVNATNSADKIAKLGETFIRDGMKVLAHGHSSVVVNLLKRALQQGKIFSVYLTESRPAAQTSKTAQILLKHNIPVTVIPDSTVAFIMQNVDIVLVGTVAIVENGGLLNTVGTYQISIVAKAFQKPVYVCAQSFKFTRLYPLDQKDFPNPSQESTPNANEQNPFQTMLQNPLLKILHPQLDYTPPSYITLLFTDLGVLTPSAVSDELIKLYS